MWTTPENEARYRELAQRLQAAITAKAGPRSHDALERDDLVAYLEWLERAREAAPCMRPFIGKRSPYALQSLSYEGMARDFDSLRAYVNAVNETLLAEA